MVRSREEKNAWQRQYNKDHREEIKAKMKQYYQDHYDERLQYRKDNSEARKAYTKQYHIDHPEEGKAYRKQYNKDHSEKQKAYNKQYAKDHPEVYLKSKKKELTRLGQIFDMTCHNMRYALMSWSKTVRNRDNNKCTWCNSTKTLVSHHIWHKAFCPESALDVDNGITLCHDCHMEQHRLDKL